MSTEVCFFQSTDQGAPVLRGTNGDAILLLDACLVNGYGSVAISSMTRSGAVVTVTTGSAHGFVMLGMDGSHAGVGPVVEVSGANETAYNGRWRVTGVTSGTVFTFSIGAATPASPATGSMSVKRASAGWSKVFSGTNKAVYRGPVGTTRMYLRVDDSTATPRYAYLRGFETMSDVDTGTGPFPTVAQQTNGMLLGKSDTADTVARSWSIAADHATFFTFVNTNNLASGYHVPGFFGDVAQPQKPGDAYHCYLQHHISTQSGITPSINGTEFAALTSTLGGTKVMYAPRAYTQIGSAALGHLLGSALQTAMSGAAIAYPAPNNSGFYMTPLAVTDGSTIRGNFPGIFSPLHAVPFPDGDILTDVQGYAGRYFLARRISSSSGSLNGQCLIDLSGPWR